MTTLSRRLALQYGGAGALAAVVWKSPCRLKAETSEQESRQSSQWAYREFLLPGFHAYADAQSVGAGEKIRFHTSSSAPFELSIVKLGPLVDDRTSDELLHTFAPADAHQQAIHPGSCVVVPNRIAAQLNRNSVALETWVRPFKVDQQQGLITQGVKPAGMGLSIASTGELQFWCGKTVTGPQLEPRNWHHVVAQYDGANIELFVNGERVAFSPSSEPLDCPNEPLLLGAEMVRTHVDHCQVDHFLDGDMAMPVVYRRALGTDAVKRRYSEKGLHSPVGDDVLACWPFAEERGERVADISGHERHGTVINHATWMIGGPSFDGTLIPRYGTQYEPGRDARRGHGLRFAADDLYDCRWEPTHEFQIPASAKSGLYAARARFEQDRKTMVYDVTFVVRKSPTQPKAPIVVLCSSNTWLAYSATPFAVNQPPGLMWGTNGMPNSHPSAPAYSCYRDHQAGQPTYQLGLRMPWPVAGPDILYSSAETGYSHLMRAERFAHVWLDDNAYDYDCITDLDLHRDPHLLNGYQTVLINGHSEYWSIDAYEGLDRYLRAGGSTVVLSGNTMFWRVTFNPDGSVMECRKFDERIGGRASASVGELYHSHDGKRGSLMRECGCPAWEVIGLECDGWGGVSPADFGVYHTEAPNHFLFQHPERVGLEQNHTFGHAPDGGLPRAIGHEWDLRLPRLKSMTKAVPAGASLPEEPAGIITLARGVRDQKATLDYFTNPSTTEDGTVAEMVYWERPQGGRVFHAGAIAAGWALSKDPHMQVLLRNVLHHFGVPPRRTDT